MKQQDIFTLDWKPCQLHQVLNSTTAKGIPENHLHAHQYGYMHIRIGVRLLTRLATFLFSYGCEQISTLSQWGWRDTAPWILRYACLEPGTKLFRITSWNYQRNSVELASRPVTSQQRNHIIRIRLRSILSDLSLSSPLTSGLSLVLRLYIAQICSQTNRTSQLSMA